MGWMRGQSRERKVRRLAARCSVGALHGANRPSPGAGNHTVVISPQTVADYSPCEQAFASSCHRPPHTRGDHCRRRSGVPGRLRALLRVGSAPRQGPAVNFVAPEPENMETELSRLREWFKRIKSPQLASA